MEKNECTKWQVIGVSLSAGDASLPAPAKGQSRKPLTPGHLKPLNGPRISQTIGKELALYVADFEESRELSAHD